MVVAFEEGGPKMNLKPKSTLKFHLPKLFSLVQLSPIVVDWIVQRQITLSLQIETAQTNSFFS